jgi:hypothetical protein
MISCQATFSCKAEQWINEKEIDMANTRPTNGPSTTGEKSGSGRGNNPPKGK